uniref:Uncharacterized protein n=1 Tax=Solanum tuberosum TaxID=4113 RepID=M1DKK5_SOLTU
MYCKRKYAYIAGEKAMHSGKEIHASRERDSCIAREEFMHRGKEIMHRGKRFTHSKKKKPCIARERSHASRKESCIAEKSCIAREDPCIAKRHKLITTSRELSTYYVSLFYKTQALLALRQTRWCRRQIFKENN